MQREKRFTIFDVLVTIICLAGFYYSLQLFNGVLNQSLNNLNEAPIGTITFKYKSAQRKLIDRVLWDRVKQNSPVYNGDIIRTAELSEATVTFVDGNIIDLYEQTLAQVFLDLEEGAAIDFSGGGVSIDTSLSSNGMVLSSGSANVQVTKGSVLNAAAPLVEGDVVSNRLSLQMSSGQANLISDGSDAVSLSEGNELVFNEQTNSFIPPSLKVVSPAVNTRYLVQEETIAIPFSWEKENIAANEYIILETSQKKDFSEIIEQISFTNVSNISLDLPEGIWYWRVYTQSLSSTVTGRLQVLSSPVPTNIVPANASNFTYRTKSPQVRFMWNDDDYARSWLFEVSDNAQMSNPLVSQITSQPSAMLSTLGAGQYYWRVTPTYSSTLLGQDTLTHTSSEISSFTIIEQGELSQAELVLPLEGGFIDANNPQEGHHFTWKYDYEAADYIIVISENENLSNPVVEQIIDENYYVLYPDVATLTEGTWYWGVTKRDSDGELSPQSEVRSLFSVQGRVEQRTLFPPDGYTVAENLVLDTSFTWKTNLPFAMKFQIASDESFNNIYTERVLHTTSISGINIPVGTWHWRIVADTENTSIPYVTDPKTFAVSEYLEKVFVNDVTGELPVIVRPSVPMEFSWEASESADYYQVTLFNNNDRETPVYENLIVEDTKIAINMDDFEEGEYSLTLRAMAVETDSSTRQTGLLNEQVFDLEKLEPITLLTPANGETFDGIQAIVNPAVLEWSSVELPQNSRLVLTNRNYGLSLESRNVGASIRESDIYFSVENPEESVQLPQLPSGTWYWTVLAETDDGFDIAPLEAAYFVVSPIAAFDAPVVINPPESLLLDIDYLKETRYIDFVWNAVAADDYTADGYILSIYDSNKKLVFEHTIDDSTEYRFDNFAVLSRGTFYWTLEAIQRLDNAVIVRRGKKEERELVVDLPIVNAPKEQRTGELYGL